MELPVSPKSPKRQVTLGPDAPIREWEVERATLVMENKEFREKAERLEKKVEDDLVTYEKNRSSLLKEVKLKEALLEKKLKDVEEQLTSQILELQHQLNKEGSSHQEAIQNLKQQHDTMLDAEDKKHQRRIASLQDRLKAKDTEYTELLGKQEEENKNEEDEGDNRVIQSLKLELEEERMKRKAEQEKWGKECDQHSELHNNQTSDANIVNQLETLQSAYQQAQTDLASAQAELQVMTQREQVHLERIRALEHDATSARAQAEQHQKRLAHAVSGHDTYIREITEKFNTEAQHAQMSTQAQVQNLVSEHNELIRELREQQETEREVWMIEKKDSLDHALRQSHLAKEEALRVQNREWKGIHVKGRLRDTVSLGTQNGGA
ncbi:hypothetical protein K501DRAFT_293438 [Backusella circina FSU 941]|nr:hypothetical protein K501DRAFT_293438 [Backusella circina FSU 941]